MYAFVWMMFCGVASAWGAVDAARVEQIHASGDPFQIRIRLSQYAPCKVVKLDQTEVLIALKQIQFPKSCADIPVDGDLKHTVKISFVNDGILTLGIKSVDELKTLETVWIDDKRTLVVTSEMPKATSPKIVSGTSGKGISVLNAGNYEPKAENLGNTARKVKAIQVDRRKIGAGTDLIVREWTADERCTDPQLRKMIHLAQNSAWEEAFERANAFLKTDPPDVCLETACFIRAVSFYKKKRTAGTALYLRAADLFQEAIRNFPRSSCVPYAIAFLGKIHLELKNYAEAMGYFKIIRAGYGEYEGMPEVMCCMGKVYLAQHESAPAISILQEMIYNFPDDLHVEKAKIELAKAFFEENNFSSVLEILNGLMKENPVAAFQRFDLLYYVGNSYYQLGKYTKARNALIRLYNYFPRNPSRDILLTRIGDTYAEQHFTDKAVKMYELTTQMFPDSDGAVIGTMRIAHLIDDSSEKEKIYRDVIKTYPDHPMAGLAMLRLARIQNDSREYEKSVAVLQKLLTKKNKDIRRDALFLLQETLLRLAGSQRRHEEYEKSIQTLQTLIAMNPERLDKDTAEEAKRIFGTYLKKFYDSGDYAGVLSCYQDNFSLIKRLNMPEVKVLIGEAFFQKYLYREAVNMFETADIEYKGRPVPSEWLYFYSMALKENGQHDQALKKMRQYARLYPESSRICDVHWKIGQILYKKQELESALRHFESAEHLCVNAAEKGKILFEEAMVYCGLGKYDRASDAQIQAVNILMSQPEKRFDAISEAYGRLGEIGLQLKAFSKAADAFIMASKFAREAGSNGSQFLYQAADAFEKEDDFERAAAIWQQMLVLKEPFWEKLALEKIRQIRLLQKCSEPDMI